MEKIDLPYNITSQTVLEFDFKSTSQGEIHGIGFDTDNVLSNDQFFQLYGTQNWGVPAVTSYDTTAPGTKHYTINVGQFFTGQMQFLTFGMDHDVANPDGEIIFSNIAIYEQSDGYPTTPTPPPSTAPDPAITPDPTYVPTVDFSTTPLTPYGGIAQDVDPNIAVQDNGRTLRIAGNSWKKLGLPYNVTVNTILEFDFKSTQQGEIHGIGFDTDDVLSNNTFFQTYGTQNWGIPAVQSYAGSEGTWKHYTIRVGDVFTGQVNYLTFGMDHDVSNPNGVGYFANIAVYDETPATPPPPPPAAPTLDPMNFNEWTLTSYDTQDVNGQAQIQNTGNTPGNTLSLSGNTWKKIQIDYNITANTILSFDFKSTQQGEVQGIGIDNDNALSSDYFFKLFGTQTWGQLNYDNYTTADGWKHYDIAIGQFFTGNARYLIFGNDHDVANPTAQSLFANVRLAEPASPTTPPPPPPVDTFITPDAPANLVPLNFNNLALASYGGTAQDVISTLNVLDGGRTLHMTGNTWKKISLTTNVTASTMLAFDFRSTAKGEIHGIGFDSDDLLTKEQFFQLYGTQNWGTPAVDSYNATAPGWKHYEINVGQFFTGLMTSLTFGLDMDVPNPNAENFFANVVIYNDASQSIITPPAITSPANIVPLDLTTFTVEDYGTTQQSNGDAVVQDNGATLNLTGNTWKKINLPYNINRNTMLEFDFRSPVQGEVQGIGFDTDNVFGPENLFKIFGTQAYGIEDFATHATGSNWTHYAIPVGQFFGGFKQYLTFANDHDVANPSADAYFTNIVLYDVEVPTTPTYNTRYGYGLIDAAAAVTAAMGTAPLPEQPYFGGAGQANLNMINAPEAWAQGYTGSGVVVAVIDTGVDWTHADLDTNIWTNPGEIAGDGIDNDGNGLIDDVRGWDFVNDDNNPMDTNGHGTMVAGVIAAENNGSGATGVAYDATIMPIRVLDGAGGGDFFSVLDGILYAVVMGADVINLSIGFDGGHPDLLAAIEFAQSNGVVVVSAAGNDGFTEPTYPATYASSAGIGVGAVNGDGSLASFSNWAGQTTKDFVVAPGVSILTTALGGGSATAGATSFATPHVAGLAALLKSANPLLSPAMIEKFITDTANSSVVFL